MKRQAFSKDDEHSSGEAQMEKTGESRLTRRDFMTVLLTALGITAALEIGGASLLFLRSRSLEGKFGDVVTAGEVEKFPNNSVTEFEDANFFLVRADDGGFLAVYRRCPHLGCTVQWQSEEERFLCPCHASNFDQFGNFLSQPVPRALDRFEIQIKDNLVLVDTTRMIQREVFSAEQLAY
jgi:cytochrome b6-f complex iron-sulfur subunit